MDVQGFAVRAVAFRIRHASAEQEPEPEPELQLEPEAAPEPEPEMDDGVTPRTRIRNLLRHRAAPICSPAVPQPE